MKRTISLEIAGARYRMTSDADEEHLAKLSTLIDSRVAALAGKLPKGASPAQILAVVALGLADDLLASEERRRRVEESARGLVEGVAARLDRSLAPGARDPA